MKLYILKILIFFLEPQTERKGRKSVISIAHGICWQQKYELSKKTD